MGVLMPLHPQVTRRGGVAHVTVGAVKAGPTLTSMLLGYVSLGGGQRGPHGVGDGTGGGVRAGAGAGAGGAAPAPPEDEAAEDAAGLPPDFIVIA